MLSISLMGSILIFILDKQGKRKLLFCARGCVMRAGSAGQESWVVGDERGNRSMGRDYNLLVRKNYIRTGMPFWQVSPIELATTCARFAFIVSLTTSP